MNALSRRLAGLAAAALLLTSTTARADSPLAGRWDATLTLNGAVIPFRLDIAGDGSTLKGTLYNGDQPETTTSASFVGGTLVLDLEHYLTRIVATERNGELDGKVQMRNDSSTEGSPFHATRHKDSERAAEPAPSIAGVWEIPHESPRARKRGA